MTLAKTNRSAVTLIELLVVLSIITLLLAMTGVAIRKTMTSQRYKMAQKEVWELQQSLDAEYERVVRECATDRRDKKIPDAVLQYADNDPDRAQALWTAMKLRRQFPDSFAEATAPLSVTWDGTNFHLRAGAPPSGESVGYSLKPLATFEKVTGLSGANESAALLYIILAEKTISGGGAMAASADEMATHRKESFGGRELEVFTDPLGQPVTFRRWDDSAPVQGQDFVDTKARFPDPLDPKGLVVTWPNATKKGEAAQFLQFNGRNRLSSVHSPGIDPADPADDIHGYVHRRFGK